MVPSAITGPLENPKPSWSRRHVGVPTLLAGARVEADDVRVDAC